jgi:mannose-6-phosphate isomerase-like protein (cupin superfamily)
VSGPQVIPPGGGEVIGDSPERRVEILSDHDAVHATWSRFGPGRAGADLHVHHRHSDVFYVLEGELTLRLGIGGDEVLVPAGTLARVPPDVVHGFRNGSAADLRYLNFHAPGTGFADYMRALRDGRSLAYDQHEPPPDGGRPTTEAVIGGDVLVAERPGWTVRLLADVEAVAIAEVSRDAGSPSPLHVHRAHVESLYVLDGELVVIAGDEEVSATASTWIQRPAGVPHVVSSTAPARFLTVHTPSSGFGDFVRALADTGDEELAAAQTAFDREPPR